MVKKLDKPKDEPTARKPPQDLQAEKALLGSILLDNRAIDDVVLIVRPEDFYEKQYRTIYEAVLTIHKADRGVADPVTIFDVMVKAGTAGDDLEQLLIELFESVPHAGYAGHYAKIVREKATYRQVSHISTDAIRDAYDQVETADELAGKTANAFLGILERHQTNEVTSIGEILQEELRHLDTKLDPGLMTGLREFDEMTQGLRPANLVIMAARPSMGKTALVLDFGIRLSERGTPVLFFSLEQSKLELAERAIARETQLSVHALRRLGGLAEGDCDKIVAAAGRMDDLPLFIDESDSPTVRTIEVISRIQQRKRGVKCILIDYLQRIEPEDNRAPREQQVARITRRLKSLAKILHVPIIVLAQLNRDFEKREDKRPQLADLRESGAIEQDADLVLLLHRPDYFDENEKPKIAELIIAKQRNGPKGRIDLHFEASTMTFRGLNLEEKATQMQGALDFEKKDEDDFH